jgi:alkylation response protein AidB-like acyl-CoA dehydrogenase
VSLAAEARSFADSVAAAADRTLPEAPAWRPGAVQDDRSPALTSALAELDWLDLARDARLAPLAGPAGVELGRRLAPLRDVDALLGGSPLVAGMIRYGGAAAIEVGARGLARRRVERSEPRAYGDAIGVHRVLALGPADPLEPEEAATRSRAWTAASVGYLAGLGEAALEWTVEHARARRAFGTTLAALAPVQQRLADAATAVRGARLLAGEAPGAAALAYAGPAIVDATAACQQVVGAIGFTLEFPLQRAFRRARALQLWAEPLLEGLGAATAGGGRASDQLPV